MTPDKDTQTYANDSATSSLINTGSAQPRSGFDLEDTCRNLIARRVRDGADSPDGHTCSNLVELLPLLPGYVRPDWASHDCQTLPWLIKQQMKRLAPRPVPNGER